VGLTRPGALGSAFPGPAPLGLGFAALEVFPQRRRKPPLQARFLGRFAAFAHGGRLRPEKPRKKDRGKSRFPAIPTHACALWGLVARIAAFAAALLRDSRVGRRRCRSSVVEHSLGKGEVLSSILSGSTTKPLIAGLFRCLYNPSRQFPAERYANSTRQNVENPWTLFTARSGCLRSRCNRKALLVTTCLIRRSAELAGATGKEHHALRKIILGVAIPDAERRSRLHQPSQLMQRT
jgi:hypothetical protein